MGLIDDVEREDRVFWRTVLGIATFFGVGITTLILLAAAHAGEGGPEYEIRQLNRAVQGLQKRVADLERIPQVKDWLAQQRERDREAGR